MPNHLIGPTLSGCEYGLKYQLYMKELCNQSVSIPRLLGRFVLLSLHGPTHMAKW